MDHNTMNNILKRNYGIMMTTLSEDSSDDDSGSTNDFIEPPKKTQKVEEHLYSNASMRMMQNMGYKPDKGLGKLGQGRLEPVETSNQKGRRGLGLKLEGLDSAATQWNPELEKIELCETVKWLQDEYVDLDILSRDVLESWLFVSTTKLTIDDETNFCDPEVLRNVLTQKSVFDKLGADDMKSARTRSNPFETIRGAIFLNRAAVKMANMDAILEFMFTNPVDEYGASLVRANDLLYFADVCAGPGGFSEYVLWRKKWQAKGFGFTLQGENDFKLHDFFAGTPETFDAYYGIKGNGDVYDPENIESFTDYVLKQTGSGVHFMMSDGGFSVDGQENVQEILSKQLYLCQCLVALSIVRVNGHFVTKLFDCFTPFSVGLIYFMYKCFKQVTIIKPNTSRPANSERYLVCKWKRSNTDTIRNHLFEINKAMFENTESKIDTHEIVPLPILMNDEQFFDYIYESNNTIGRNQVIGLMKIAAYSKDPDLREPRQAEIQKECLKLWKIPNQSRKAPPKQSTDKVFQSLMLGWNSEKDFLSAPDKKLSINTDLYSVFHDVTDWYFVPLDVVENSVSKNIRTFFMSKGNREVYKYEERTWIPVNDVVIEMPSNTLIYGEIAKELNGEGGAQTMVYALHIIDGIMLGGEDIRSLPLKKRNQMCQKFAAALNKPRKLVTGLDGQQLPIRCKPLIPLSELRLFFGRLNPYKLKDRKTRLGLQLRDPINTERFFVPRGILLFRDLKPHLKRDFNPHTQQMVYTDLLARGKQFSLHQLSDKNSIYASFKSSFPYRRLWEWEVATQVEEHLDESERMSNFLYRVDFENFIYGQIE